MSIRFRIFLLSFFALGIANAQSRSGYTIQGIVIDSTTKLPLREAPVSLLLAKDSAFVTFTITGGEGNFIFRNVPEGNYRVLVTYLGYRNISRDVTLNATAQHINLGLMEMGQISIQLKEVVIQQEQTPVILRNDTLEFNAQSFKTRPNAQVEDLLKKMPGIEISRDGTIKAHGQEVKKVLVDGKPFFGDDPKMATRNLPAEIIEKVQLFDQQSDQSTFSGFDDGDREKTINLTTKKDKRKGTFGRSSLGFGTQNRYQGRLNLNHFNNSQQISLLGLGNNINQQAFTLQDMFNFGSEPSGSQMSGGGSNMSPMGDPMEISSGNSGNKIGNSSSGNTNNLTESWAGGMNYRDTWGKKIDVNGSYFFNFTDIITAQKNLRQNILPDTTYFNAKDNSSKKETSSHRLNFRIDYQLDSMNTFRFTPNLTLQNTTYTSLSDSKAFTKENKMLNQSKSENLSSGDGLSWNSNLLYLHKFRKRGRTFSFNLFTLLNDQQTLGTNQSNNVFYDTLNVPPLSRMFNQQYNQQSNIFNKTATLSYTEPISIRQTVELHYAYGHNLNKSNRMVNDYDESSGQYDQWNEKLSNQFTNTFATQRAGFNIQNRRLKYTYSLGLDLQKADLRNNFASDSLFTKQYINLLPNTLFTYIFNSKRSLRINYRARTNAPTVSQLQPVPDQTDPLNIRLGNPGLKPEYINQINAVYNFYDPANFHGLFAALNLNQTYHKIVSTTQFTSVGSQTTQPVNQNGYYLVNGFLAISRPVRPVKANLHLTSNVNYSRGISLVNDRPNEAHSFVIQQGVSMHSNFTGKFEYGISGNINYQQATYSLQKQQNTSFFFKTLSADLYYELPFRFFFTTDLTYNSNTGRSAAYNQQFILWNAAIARQFFKNKQGELKIEVYDLLNQNRSIVRNTGETYIEDVESKVLKQYFMLSFTYHLRKFGGNNPFF